MRRHQGPQTNSPVNSVGTNSTLPQAGPEQARTSTYYQFHFGRYMGESTAGTMILRQDANGCAVKISAGPNATEQYAISTTPTGAVYARKPSDTCSRYIGDMPSMVSGNTSLASIDLSNGSSKVSQEMEKALSGLVRSHFEATSNYVMRIERMASTPEAYKLSTSSHLGQGFRVGGVGMCSASVNDGEIYFVKAQLKPEAEQSVFVSVNVGNSRHVYKLSINADSQVFLRDVNASGNPRFLCMLYPTLSDKPLAGQIDLAANPELTQKLGRFIAFYEQRGIAPSVDTSRGVAFATKQDFFKVPDEAVTVRVVSDVPQGAPAITRKSGNMRAESSSPLAYEPYNGPWHRIRKSALGKDETNGLLREIKKFYGFMGSYRESHKGDPSIKVLDELASMYEKRRAPLDPAKFIYYRQQAEEFARIKEQMEAPTAQPVRG